MPVECKETSNCGTETFHLNMTKMPYFLSGVSLLERRHRCLVQVVTSFWCANSHIISFFKWTLSENCTYINKPATIRMNQQDQHQSWAFVNAFVLTLLNNSNNVWQIFESYWDRKPNGHYNPSRALLLSWAREEPPPHLYSVCSLSMMDRYNDGGSWLLC